MQALQIENLQKVYSNGTIAVNNMTFSIEQGDFFALLGPNGAGKSSAIGIITSLITKTAGSVTVFGHNLDIEPYKARCCIGLVPQEFNCAVFEKVIDILLFQAGYYGVSPATAKKQAEYYLKKLELWDQRNIASRFLSGGMKKRLMIARALVHLTTEPQLLILDEPTAGVDIELRHTIWSFLQELNQKGTTIILTTHYLEEAEHLCKNVAIINHGKIIENTSMHSLLGRLQSETLIFDLHSSLHQLPNNNPFGLRYLNTHQIEVDFPTHKTLNELFVYFQKEMIEVRSIKTKFNRLETLFINSITNHYT